MKNGIQQRYFESQYRLDNIPFDCLRVIIQEVWEAILDSFIEALVDSWWDYCNAMITAEGGPTKY